MSTLPRLPLSIARRCVRTRPANVCLHAESAVLIALCDSQCGMKSKQLILNLPLYLLPSTIPDGTVLITATRKLDSKPIGVRVRR